MNIRVECLKSNVHELRHAYQIIMADNPLMVLHSKWIEELKNLSLPID